jgi:hypothetical protein
VAGALGLLRREAAGAGGEGQPDPGRLGPLVVAVGHLLAEALDPTGTVAREAPLLAGAHGSPAALPAPVRQALTAAASVAGVDLLGQAHEALLAPAARRRGGAFYTPRRAAEGLVAMAWHGWPRRPGSADGLSAAAGAGAVTGQATGWATVCDPACGGGAFLLAAARHLRAAGAGARPLVEEALGGLDLDPLAAAVADASLRLWAASEGERVARTQVRVGDALAPGRPWAPAGVRLDLVVGNPPFQNQLEAATVRDGVSHAGLRDRFGDAARAYADTSSLFLAAALAAVGPGGRVALLLPESFLAARDAGGVRASLAEQAELVGLWAAGDGLFTASVGVVGVVAERPATSAAAPAEVARWVGAARRPAPSIPAARARLGGGPWGGLVADLVGVPAAELRGEGRLADLAGATAGFRHQFYGLAPFVVDGASEARGAAEGSGGARPGLVVSGLIDPANLRWGRQPARFAGRAWAAPEVDLAALEAADPALARWGRARLRPKVLVATQTRVVEAVVDETGRWWPSVPVVSVEPEDPADLWRLAAVLLAPPVTAWARARYAGTALSGDAVKLAARQVLELPLPAGVAAWERGAAATATATAASLAGDAGAWRAALLEGGAAMCEAYGVGDEVLAWWAARLPPHR